MYPPISQSALFGTQMCIFLFYMVHCGIWDRCIVIFMKFWLLKPHKRLEMWCLATSCTHILRGSSPACGIILFLQHWNGISVVLTTLLSPAALGGVISTIHGAAKRHSRFTECYLLRQRDQATSHYLNQWWLVYRRIYASLRLNELSAKYWHKILIMIKPLQHAFLQKQFI